MIEILIFMVGMLSSNYELYGMERFYDGFHNGCVGATVVLLEHQNIEVSPDEIIAYCSELEGFAIENGMHVNGYYR